MTHVATVQVGKPGRFALPKAAERALGLRREGRLLVLTAGRAVVLVPEDAEARRIVAKNERILRERGVTVRDVLRVLRKQRRAGSHGRP